MKAKSESVRKLDEILTKLRNLERNAAQRVEQYKARNDNQSNAANVKGRTKQPLSYVQKNQRFIYGACRVSILPAIADAIKLAEELKENVSFDAALDLAQALWFISGFSNAMFSGVNEVTAAGYALMGARVQGGRSTKKLSTEQEVFGD